MGRDFKYDKEEIANAVLHGVGLGMAISALVVLVVVANIFGDLIHIIANSIYGSTLIILYLASTLYHSFPRGKAKYVFKIIDHSAIFLLIAGTYTPITMVFLRGVLGWTIFALIWLIAGVGIIINIIWFERVQKISLFLYILMGWLSIFALRPLLLALNRISIIFLVVGGLFYTSGIFFYIKDNLKYNHAIWHIFVLAGSVSHFFTILFNIIS